MGYDMLFGPDGLLWTPVSFTALLAFSVMLAWMAFAPAKREREEDERISSYLTRPIALDDTDLRIPVMQRVIVPALRRCSVTGPSCAPCRATKGPLA